MKTAKMRDFFHRRRLDLYFEPDETGGLRELGRLNYEKAHLPLRLHQHRGAMEICYLARGSQTYVVGGKSYHLRPGDVFVTFPGEKHSTGSTPEEKSILYWLVVDVSKSRKPFLLLPTHEGRVLKGLLYNLSARLFPAGADLQHHLDAAIEEVLKGGQWSKLLCRQSLISFLTGVTEYAKSDSGQNIKISRAMSDVIEHIEKHICEALPLEELADLAGLSVSRFKQRFKDEIGIPPREYVLRNKIRKAEELIRQKGWPVTKTAFALGFSSSQYFATVFRRYKAATPSGR